MRQIIKNCEPGHFSKWKSDFKALNGRDATYEDLKGTDEYFRLKKSLIEEQGFICCYCEKRIGQKRDLSDCDIEYFMPRHPDTRILSTKECELCTNAQMEYSNLFASCKGEFADSADHCNHKKDNWFDFKSCISPCDSKINGLFGFKLKGTMFAKLFCQKVRSKEIIAGSMISLLIILKKKLEIELLFCTFFELCVIIVVFKN